MLAERNYSDSAKRLFLTNAHLCESLQQLALASDMTNAQAAQKLLDLIGFSDTNQLLMSNGSYAAGIPDRKLEQRRGRADRIRRGVTCSLPGLRRKKLHHPRQRHL